VAQLGSGQGSGYPNTIDTRQTWVNGASPAPDSNTRLDSECVNDLAAAIIALQTSLGANVNGVFGSLAARLNQAFPGSGGVPGITTFTQQTTVSVAGTQHNVGQAAMLFRLYDAQIPAHAIAAGSFLFSVDDSSYDVTVGFGTPVSGSLAMGVTSPLYLASYTNATTVNILGVTHQLGTSDLLFQNYDASTPRHAQGVGSLTVHPTTHDVVMTFATPTSGLLLLAASGPTYAVNFTSVTTISIPGSVHQLGTQALLWQFYDASTPRAALGDPGCTVNPNTYDVVYTFTTPTSGRLVLMPAATLTGRDFDIRDSGVINQSATRVRSASGMLHLQAGIGQKITLEDKLGTSVVTVDATTKRVGINVPSPTHELQLSTGDAAMPGGGPWLAPSTTALKEDIRPFREGLETLLQLEPVWYRYNGLGGIARSATPLVGLLAETVQTLAPYLVRTYRGRLRPEDPETDLAALDTGPVLYLLINAIKTLQGWLLEARQSQQRLEQQVALLATRLTAIAPLEQEEE